MVFDNAIPGTSFVQVQYSYRSVQVRLATEPWWKAAAFRSLRTDDIQYTNPAASGGAWDVLSQNRVQLPALVVEDVPRAFATPLEIGNSTRIHNQDFLIHVLAETPWERRRLHDVLMEQYDKRIPSYDRNEVTFPLDPLGRVRNGALTYPQLVEANPWRQIRVAGAQSAEQEDISEKFYWCTVRYTLSVDAP